MNITDIILETPSYLDYTAFYAYHTWTFQDASIALCARST